MEELRRRINEVARDRLSADDLRRQIEIDGEVSLEELTPEAVSELDRLAPFGMGNPAPVLVTRGLRLDGVTRVGDGSHLSLKLRGERGGTIGGIWFRSGELKERLEAAGRVHLCFRPRLEEWNGVARVRLQVEDVGAWEGE